MSKTVNSEKIKKLDPCNDRFENYIQHYGDRTFTVKEFLALKHITFSDKVWVAFRLMPKKNIRFTAGNIAKTVLHMYEDQHPDDDRPRNAIKEALRVKLNIDASYAAYAAAYAAASASAAAYAYAYASASSAAYAASAAAYAAASASSAAYAAASASSAAYAAYAADNLEKKHLKIIQKYWENE